MAKKRVNHRAMVIQDNTVTFSNVVVLENGDLETEDDILPAANAKRYFDEKAGQILYVFNLDLPAKVEAENLKQLRRSKALARIFSYGNKKESSFGTMMPWIAIILIVFLMGGK